MKYFLLGTAIITLFTLWSFIKTKHFHVFFRFISFEVILAMVLMTYKVWFVDAYGFIQFFSWLSLGLSIVLAAVGFSYLLVKGKPKGYFEKTTKFVTSGIYDYVRHPMYGSLILLGTGVFIKNVNWLMFALFMINIIAIYLTAITEERELIKKFDHEYQLYIARTKMFVPYLF